MRGRLWSVTLILDLTFVTLYVSLIFLGSFLSMGAHKLCCWHSLVSSTSTGHFVGTALFILFVYLCMYLNPPWAVYFSFHSRFSSHEHRKWVPDDGDGYLYIHLLVTSTIVHT